MTTYREAVARLQRKDLEDIAILAFDIASYPSPTRKKNKYAYQAYIPWSRIIALRERIENALKVESYPWS